jgi:hypothetical protein
MTSTIIGTQLAVDPALVMDANYKFARADRRYIDDQVRAIEQLIVDNLINGHHASWFNLDGGSASVIAGDTVCNASVAGGGLVTKAVAAALGPARSIAGVVLTAASPGSKVLVAIGGILSNSITGLASGLSGFVKVNTTTSRCERVAGFSNGEVVVGTVDAVGWLNIALGPEFSSGGGGGAGTGDLDPGLTKVLGIKGVLLETADALTPGQVWKKRGTKLRAGKAPGVGCFDVEDYGAIPDFNYGTLTGTDNLAAFNACIAAMSADTGNRAQMMVANGHFYLSDTLVIPITMTLAGSGCGSASVGGNRSSPGTWLVFPANVDGIVIASGYEPGSGEQTHIQNLTVWCKANPPGWPGYPNATLQTGHGIRVNSPATIRDVFVENFGENGVYIDAGTTLPATPGNAGGSYIENVNVGRCGGSGFHMLGSDASVCTFVRCTGILNYGWGFFDESTGGNTFIGCHAEGNKGYRATWAALGYNGDWSNASSGSCASTFIGCYTEVAQNLIYYPAMAYGGLLGAPIDGTGIGNAGTAMTLGGGNFVGGQPLACKNILGTESTVAEFGQPNSTNGGLMNFYLSGLTDWLETTWHTGSKWYSVFNQSESNTLRCAIRYPSSLLEPRAIAPLFDNGLFYGVANTLSNNASREITHHDTATALPTTGTWEVGDIAWNSAPTSAGDVLGWRCTVAGTMGTLSGVTGSVTAAATDLVVNSQADLTRWAYIRIAGVLGIKQIVNDLQRNTALHITLSSAASDTVAGAAVSFSPATFEAMYALSTSKSVAGPTVTGTITHTNGAYTRELTLLGAAKTTTATTKVITSYTLADESSVRAEFSANLKSEVGSSKAGSFGGTVCYQRNAAGAPAIVGSAVYAAPQRTVAGDDVTWDVSGNILRVLATSADGDDRQWSATLKVLETLSPPTPTIPATLNLSGFWVADYAGSPWLAEASAGVSETTGDLVTGSAEPAISNPQNGLHGPDFSGTQGLANATDATTLFTTTAGTIIVVFYADSVSAPAANIYEDVTLFRDNNTDHGIALSSAGLTAYAYQSGYKYSPTVACSTGAWHIAMLRREGSILGLTLDGAAEVTVACTTLTVMTGSAVVGVGYGGGYFNGHIFGILTSPADLSASYGAIKSYFEARLAITF